MARRGILCALCLLCVSCASERLQARSARTPDWVVQPPEPTEEHLLVVGRAIGRNILDERAMRTRSLADARAQVASMVQTRVSARTREVVKRLGHGPSGEEQTSERYDAQLRTSAEQRISGLRQTAYYWEKWRVDPGPLRAAFTRYKYFVLASYPLDAYRRALDYFTRLVKDRARAGALIEEGRPLEAAKLLESLLDEDPRAPLSVRLALARAYERAGLLGRAEEVLERALGAAEEGAERARVRERLERVRASYPDLGGRSVMIYVGRADRSVPLRRGWFEEACARSNAPVVGFVETGAEPPSERPPAAGADWLVEVRLASSAPPASFEHHGIEMHRARIECSVRILGLPAREVLAGVTEQGRAVERGRARALNLASRRAVQTALREAFLTLAAGE